MFKDYYEILGLENTRVSIDEIKSAYRSAAKKYNQDLNVGYSFCIAGISNLTILCPAISSAS